MKPQRLAAFLILAIFGVTMFAPWIAPSGYAQQDRNAISLAPGSDRAHPLGTDTLGRDRLARLLYGMRISLLLAPAAALFATCLAAAVGAAGGILGGWAERTLLAVIDIFLSVPWLFLLLTVRALMPLNTTPVVSIGITFILLAALGWAASARLVCSGVREVLQTDFILLARANGAGISRIVAVHILPNLRPVLAAQFLITVPAFILAEANLGMLGLGVSEPMPTWGNLLRELESFSALKSQPWLWTPLITLVIVVSCFQFILQEKEPTI